MPDGREASCGVGSCGARFDVERVALPIDDLYHETGQVILRQIVLNARRRQVLGVAIEI